MATRDPPATARRRAVVRARVERDAALFVAGERRRYRRVCDALRAYRDAKRRVREAADAAGFAQASQDWAQARAALVAEAATPHAGFYLPESRREKDTEEDRVRRLRRARATRHWVDNARQREALAIVANAQRLEEQ